jgi:hypothetical protein
VKLKEGGKLELLYSSYSLLPLAIKATAFYFSTVWYPSLGFGLLFCGLYIGKVGDVIRSMPYSGILIILSSTILIPLSYLFSEK